MKRLLPLTLILSLMASMIAPAEGSTPPVKPGSAPVETPPETLYTEAEALAAADAAVKAALEEAIPRAVQAAVAQRDGELAAKDATIAGLRFDLGEEAKASRKARAWTIGVAVGGSVVAAAAFIAGAWVAFALTP